MPTYEYQCEECGIVFERFQHFAEEPIKVCPECNGAVHRLFHPVGIIFKGSGFYVTDHRGNNSALGGKTKSNGEEKEATGSKTPKADPATAAKAETSPVKTQEKTEK